MDDIIAKAEEYRTLFSSLKIAHEKSAEWHRSLGEKLGGAEKGISTIVGTAIFVGVASLLGLNGKGTISIPEGWGGSCSVYACSFVLNLCTRIDGSSDVA